MGLQISVFLLFLLFTAGHSLQCYECISQTGSCAADQKATTCPAGSSWCESKAITYIGDTTSKELSKQCATECDIASLNYGYVRINSSCCNTELCNRQDPSDPVPNGKKCYTCDEKGCSKTLSCSGDEDRCITITDNSGGQSMVIKGCTSKSLCVGTALVKNDGSSSCCEGNLCNCEGNLCNGAQSVPQSFLFLSCSLLSYFLLH